MSLLLCLGSISTQAHCYSRRSIPILRVRAARRLFGQGLKKCCAGGVEPVPSEVPLSSGRVTPFDAKSALKGMSSEEQSSCFVVNFYHLVEIPNPLKVVEEHKCWMKGRDVRGRIYLSSQGINAQYTGPQEDALAYPEWLKQQGLFQFKPNLVQLKGGMPHLPIASNDARATLLKPHEWKEMLQNAKNVSKEDKGHPVFLDVRNGYEWDAGHFDGVDRPKEDAFNQTPVGGGEEDIPESLVGRGSDTPIMMYCTGGIRCDVYSTFLRKRGFKNIFSLEGGVQKYFKEEGGDHWNGSLFVFDDRLAVSPSKKTGGPLPAAVSCELCESAPGDLPHRNCANIDCNKLFIACPSCLTKLQGCCCQECISAPRLLRPLVPGRFEKWGAYSKGSRSSRTQHLQKGPEEAAILSPSPSSKRRKRISERRNAKKEALRLQKQERKNLMKKAAETCKHRDTKSLAQQLQRLDEVASK